MTRTVVEEALRWIERGCAPIPTGYRSKKPVHSDWQELRITAADVPKFFNGGRQNLSMVLGVGGLTDVDLDCDEAVVLAPMFLPETGAKFGRKSKRASHWLYYTDLTATEGKARLMVQGVPGTSATKRTLVELRIGGGAGMQTVFPPSSHEDAPHEDIEWDEDGEPARVEGSSLKRAYQKVGVGSLILLHYPDEGSRHHTWLAMGGMLGRLGWDEDEAGDFAETIAKAAGETRAKIRNRRAAARDSVRNLAAGKKEITGLPTLKELLGEDVGGLIAKALEYEDSDKQRAEFHLELLSGADLIPRQQEWLWQGRVPRGTLSLLIGLPDVGKSHIFIDACARVTSGRLFPPERDAVGDEAGRVLIVCTEDRVEHTLVPRLMAAGADMRRVSFLRFLRTSKGEQRGLDLTQDVQKIETFLEQHPDTDLVVFDPISEFLGAKIDSHSNTAVRSVLGQLMDMLDRRNVAALGVSHLPKAKNGAVQTASIGSIGFSACARSSLLVVDEMETVEDDDGRTTLEPTGRKLLCVNKGNLAPPDERETLAFTLQPHTLDAPHDDITVARVNWDGPVEVTAREVWEASDKPREPTKRDEAARFIKDLMRDPENPDTYCARVAQEVRAEAKAAGITEHTLTRARDKLGIVPRQEEGTGVWMWPVPLRWGPRRF